MTYFMFPVDSLLIADAHGPWWHWPAPCHVRPLEPMGPRPGPWRLRPGSRTRTLEVVAIVKMYIYIYIYVFMRIQYMICISYVYTYIVYCYCLVACCLGAPPMTTILPAQTSVGPMSGGAMFASDLNAALRYLAIGNRQVIVCIYICRTYIYIYTCMYIFSKQRRHVKVEVLIPFQ